MMWTIWHRVAKNKMKLKVITDNGPRIKYPRRYASGRRRNAGCSRRTGKERGGTAHTYEQMVEGMMMTLLSDALSMQVSVLKRDQEEPGTSRTARTRNVRHNREEDGDLDGEGRGREVQGRDIDEDMYKAEGAGVRVCTRPRARGIGE